MQNIQMIDVTYLLIIGDVPITHFRVLSADILTTCLLKASTNILMADLDQTTKAE